MVLRPFLQAWLRSAAADKLRREAVEAARKHVRSTTQQAQAAVSQPGSEPCYVGLVFALRIESGCLEDLLEAAVIIQGDDLVVRQGELAGRRVALAISGPGRKNAAKATEALIRGHRPGWLLSAGFAGGLKPELKRQDVLVANDLVDTSGGRLAVDLPGDPAGLAAAPGVHVGRLLTAERIIRLPEEKVALGKKYDAAAVDMETFAVAEECRRQKVPFLAVRVINDAADDTLPRDVEKLLAQKTPAARLGAAVGAIWRRPSSVKDMYKLRENALLASDRLAKFLSALIELL